jgi:hypothetical protein
MWAHAAGKKTGMVISNYSNFKICLRYNGWCVIWKKY